MTGSTDQDPLYAAIRDWTSIFVRMWMHDINRFTRSTGLSFGQMNLLMHIFYNGPYEVSGVSELLVVSAAGASQMVERMVQQGLVIRNEVPGDRRVRLVDITEEGRKVVLDYIKAHQKWVTDMGNSFEPDQRESVIRMLNMMTEKAEKLEYD